MSEEGFMDEKKKCKRDVSTEEFIPTMYLIHMDDV